MSPCCRTPSWPASPSPRSSSTSTWRPESRSSPATSARSVPCWTAGGGERWSGRATHRRWPMGSVVCSRTRSVPGTLPRPRAGWPCGSTRGSSGPACSPRCSKDVAFVRWPADHPALTDPALASWAVDADRLCPEAEVIRVLRHLPGRRVTTLVRTHDGLAVLKLFATSRARGGHRRLSAFADSPARSLVPRPLGYRKGHLALVEFIPGTPLDRVADVALTPAAGLAGRA